MKTTKINTVHTRTQPVEARDQELDLAVLDLDMAIGSNFRRFDKFNDQDLRDMRTLALAYDLPELAERFKKPTA